MDKYMSKHKCTVVPKLKALEEKDLNEKDLKHTFSSWEINKNGCLKINRAEQLTCNQYWGIFTFSTQATGLCFVTPSKKLAENYFIAWGEGAFGRTRQLEQEYKNNIIKYNYIEECIQKWFKWKNAEEFLELFNPLGKNITGARHSGHVSSYSVSISTSHTTSSTTDSSSTSTTTGGDQHLQKVQRIGEKETTESYQNVVNCLQHPIKLFLLKKFIEFKTENVPEISKSMKSYMQYSVQKFIVDEILSLGKETEKLESVYLHDIVEELQKIPAFESLFLFSLFSFLSSLSLSLSFSTLLLFLSFSTVFCFNSNKQHFLKFLTNITFFLFFG